MAYHEFVLGGAIVSRSKCLNLDGAAGRTRNRLVDGLSAPSHYAAAFSSPSPTFAGRVSFHTAAARCHYQEFINFNELVLHERKRGYKHGAHECIGL